MVSNSKHRIALSSFFFLMGFCFATWASRIPTLKDNLELSEADLGSLLVLMPISALAGIPTSGWLVAKFDSRVPIIIGLLMQTVFLLCIGLSSTIWTLSISIFFFAFFVRISGIAVNTQAITLQGLYQKKINGSFHALWSVGGIGGIVFTSVMVYMNIGMRQHFILVTSMAAISSLLMFRVLLKNDKAVGRNRLQLGKPDPKILSLGIIILCTAICEGGMFDWSGIYFQEVVGSQIFTSGYLTFMTCMAISRFLTDRITNKIGVERVYIISALILAAGLGMAVSFPYFWPAMIGFALVGFGTASVIPTTYLLVGRIEKYSAGMTISILSTYGLIGIFIGPPMIGYVAHLTSLRISFILVALFGLLMIPVSRYFFSIRSN